jgi:sugar-specific transcriptional regulator TrmB
MQYQKKSQAIETLVKLGLNENEALLYTTLLKYPKSTVQQMTTRCPFPRTMLYYILNQLSSRRLVTAIKDKSKTVYVVENPERLYELLTEKEKTFSDDTHSIRSLIPELKNKYRLAGKRPNIRMFEGVKEYKKALEDIIISKPNTIYAYINLQNTKKPGIECRETYDGKRTHKKIQKRILLFESKTAREHIKQCKYNDYTQYRLVKTKIELFTTDFQLYNGKILYTTYEEREPVTILIEDQSLFKMQKSLFDSLWLQGVDATLLSI